jgi:hypothetical protein
MVLLQHVAKQNIYSIKGPAGVSMAVPEHTGYGVITNRESVRQRISA